MEAEGEHPKGGASLAHGFYMFGVRPAHTVAARHSAIVELIRAMIPRFSNVGSNSEIGVPSSTAD